MYSNKILIEYKIDGEILLICKMSDFLSMSLKLLKYLSHTMSRLSLTYYISRSFFSYFYLVRRK